MGEICRPKRKQIIIYKKGRSFGATFFVYITLNFCAPTLIGSHSFIPLLLFTCEKNSFKSSGVHSIASPPCFWSGQYLYLMFTPCFTSSSTRAVQSPSLAVLKKYRSMRIGSALIAAAELTARSMGAELLQLHSQLRAKEFYQKCGYQEFGEIELDEGCPHIWMKKYINN